ncbi:MAG TPA: histidine kinase [Bacteroidales bacterium]|nr:histidine kinase [Bacteroidales bacterium]
MSKEKNGDGKRILDSLWVKIGLHISLWAIYFLLSYIFLKSYWVNIKPDFLLGDMVIYMIIFYVSYLVLIPLLLFRRKTLLFILCLLPLFFGAFYMKKEFRRWHFQKIVKEEMHRAPEAGAGGREYRIPGRPPATGMRAPGQWNSFFTARDLSAFTGILVVFLAALSISSIERWRKDEKAKSEREKERTTAELKYLKQQINPHFLFNSLNSIYSMTISHPSPASDAILKLSSILRYMLYAADNEKVSLRNELEVVENYLELQKLRLTNKVTVNFSMEVSDEHFEIEPHILIPLLENAFKYGADNITESFIDIGIVIRDEKLDFTVRNKIVLRPTSDQDSGIGIKNIARRLELVYPQQYKFRIHEKDDIFTVNLIINLHR